MIINEIELKEKIFKQIIKQKKYKSALNIFNNTDKIEQHVVIKNGSIKVNSKNNNNEYSFTIELNNFHIIPDKCNIHKEEFCECNIVAILYFLNNYTFDYFKLNFESITPFDFITTNNEIKTGYILKDNEIHLAEINFKKNNIYYLKKYLSSIENINEYKIEYLLSYEKFSKSPQFFIQKSKRTLIPLVVSDEFLKIFISFERLNDNFIKINSYFENQEDIFNIFKGIGKRIVIFNSGIVKIIPCYYNFESFDTFLNKPQIINFEQLNKIIYNEDNLKNYNIIIDKKNISGLNCIDVEPEVNIYLEMFNSYLKVEVMLKYDKFTFNIFHNKRIIDNTIIFKNSIESEILETFKSLNAIIENNYFLLNKNATLEFLINILPAKFSNCNIFGEEKLTNLKIYKPQQSNSTISMFSYKEWFEIDAGLTFENKKITLKELIKNIKKGKNYIKLNKNEYGVIPDNLIQKIKKILNDEAIVFDKSREKFKIFKVESLSRFNKFKDIIDTSEIINEFKALKNKINKFQNISEYKLPEEISTKLRDYQKTGVKWLIFLKDFNLNGILADEMGLGKTIQALALLFMERENKPNLVVVPASLLFNWENEIRKFFKSINYILLYGKDRDAMYKNLKNYSLIITTYNIVRIDIEKLSTINFNYIILDESQNIKNPYSVISNFLKKLKSNHRLSLTGTPFQNSLTDVWSQFEFLHPGLLGSLKDFKKKYENNVEKLRKKLSPLILRRKKEDVLKELPSKTEINYFYKMNDKQKEFYESVKAFYIDKIESSIIENGFLKSRMIIIEGLLRLRQICCHPKLVKFEHINYKNIKSEKFENLKKIIKAFYKKGSKTVIYSQFVQMLKIISNFLKKEEISFEYLDGATNNRKKVIENFQNNSSIKFFLISTKAGGTGINLTSAENVIIYDPWWNPSVEMQAIDRIHRIGQEKKIFAYRLIVKDSVEEKILKLQHKKQTVLNKLLDLDSIISNLTREDIEYIFY